MLYYVMSLITCIQNCYWNTLKNNSLTHKHKNYYNHDSQHRLKKPFSSIVFSVLAAVSTPTVELCPLLCTMLWVTVELFCGVKDGSMLAALSWLCWNSEITPWATFRKASFTPIQEMVSNTKWSSANHVQEKGTTWYVKSRDNRMVIITYKL